METKDLMRELNGSHHWKRARRFVTANEIHQKSHGKWTVFDSYWNSRDLRTIASDEGETRSLPWSMVAFAHPGESG